MSRLRISFLAEVDELGLDASLAYISIRRTVVHLDQGLWLTNSMTTHMDQMFFAACAGLQWNGNPFLHLELLNQYTFNHAEHL